MAERILICASADVAEGGMGVRFPVHVFGEAATGFVVRRGGKAYGYLNRCAHVPTELDWFKGEFFESSGRLNLAAVSRMLDKNRSSAQRAFGELQQHFRRELKKLGG